MSFVSENIEIITPEIFMERMHIKRTTYYEWRRSGKLVRGRHYVKVKRVIEILWCLNLIRELDDPPKIKDKPAMPVQTRRKGSAIDLNYGE